MLSKVEPLLTFESRYAATARCSGYLLPQPAQLREDNGYLKKMIDIMAAR